MQDAPRPDAYGSSGPDSSVRPLSHDEAALFVDVRDASAFAFGHIPGAVNLPENDFDTVYPSLRARLEAARTVVVYCDSARCARSLRVAIRLRTLGLAQAQIYPAGWNEWFERQLPVERSADR